MHQIEAIDNFSSVFLFLCNVIPWQQLCDPTPTLMIMIKFREDWSEDIWDWRGQDVAESRGITIDKILLPRLRDLRTKINFYPKELASVWWSPRWLSV